jgi:hypothetical protein
MRILKNMEVRQDVKTMESIGNKEKNTLCLMVISFSSSLMLLQRRKRLSSDNFTSKSLKFGYMEKKQRQYLNFVIYINIIFKR